LEEAQVEELVVVEVEVSHAVVVAHWARVAAEEAGAVVPLQGAVEAGCHGVEVGVVGRTSDAASVVEAAVAAGV
jgi:hypothetical protein